MPMIKEELSKAGVPEDRKRACYCHPVRAPDGTVLTDDYQGYAQLPSLGYIRKVVSPDELKLPHLAASLLKRWLLGTYQGAVRSSHLGYYLDEYTFRFNRRTSRSRGKLFYRLVQQALHVDPLPEAELKASASPHTEANLDVLES